MDTSAHSARRRRRLRRAGFSLIEIMLVIGIISFAFLGIFGLLPNGLRIFRQAMDTSVGSQIAQQVVSDMQQTDFDELVTDESGKVISGSYVTGRKAVRYFDDQGNELPATKADRAIYHVNIRIMPATSVPKTASDTEDNTHLATVTIQVAHNPGNKSLSMTEGAAGDENSPRRNLWSGALSSDPKNTAAVRILTYLTLVARNK